jgi:PKD repeat protein
MSCGNETSNTITVTVNPLPTVSFSLLPDTTQLHHYIAVNNSTGLPPLSYDWSWGDGTHDSIPYPSHTYADSGVYTICLSVTDSTGCTNTFCDSSYHIMRTTNYMVYIDVMNPLLTGNKEVNLQTAQVTLYPNPATNQITILSSSFHNEVVAVSIMNVLGQEALSYSLSFGEGRGEAIDISKLSAGMFFIQIKTENGSLTKKFVKE